MTVPTIKEVTPQTIKAIRTHYGLSQRAFAQLLGMGEASIARYEQGVTPTKANANLIRAAAMPEFMHGCLEREGDALTPKQRETVEKVIYTEIQLNEEGEIMDMTDIYEITLRQEVLNEKAAEILADVINGLIKAEDEGDEALRLVYEDLFTQLALLKPTIATFENANWTNLHVISGQLDCMRALFDRAQQRRAA